MILVMYMKKQIIAFLLGVLITLPVGAYATSAILSANFTSDKVMINGVEINTQVAAIKKDGDKWPKTFASFADIADALGTKAYIENGYVILDARTSLEKVVKNCKDSCVMIYAYLPSGAISQGSGWVYNGYIVTAKHVIEGSTKIDVFTDDSLYGVSGTIVPIETDLDIAVLKISVDLPSVTLGDSDKLIEGEKLVSITSPKGSLNQIDECINSGFVTYAGNEKYLSISEGNMNNGSSGGAIFDYRGDAVSMVIIGQYESHDTIPINDIKPIFETII
jgi:S1-C subfamily serine protease